jgi:hypothetical protein
MSFLGSLLLHHAVFGPWGFCLPDYMPVPPAVELYLKKLQEMSL